MKRLLISFVTVLFALTPSSAQSVKKLFDSAIKRGPGSDMTYEIVNKGQNPISKNQLMQYASSNGILVVSSSYKKIERFGDLVETLDNCKFITKNDYYKYLTVCIFEANGLALNGSLQQMSSGKCRLIISDGGKYFYPTDNVSWAGKTVNGMLEGPGVGYALEDGKIVVFDGTFKAGNPTNKNRVFVYNIEDGKPFSDETKKSVYVLRMGDFKEGLAWFNIMEGLQWYNMEGGYCGFISEDGQKVCPPRFSRIISEYNSGHAEVVDGTFDFVIDDNFNYVDITKEYQEELIDYSNSKVISKIDDDNHFLFFQSDHIKANNSGYNRASRYKNLLETYPDFPRLKEISAALTKRIVAEFHQHGEDIAMVNSYNEAVDREKAAKNAELSRYNTEFKARQGVKNVKMPEEKRTSLFRSESSYYEMVGGEIELTDGTTYEWEIRYDNGDSEYYFETGSSAFGEAQYSKAYSSFDKMVDGILEHYRRR